MLANGIGFHVAVAGPPTGDPVLLLHGFPEFWYGWRHQIDALAAAGHRVIVPDLRGYNRTDKPDGVAAYAMEELVADVTGLLDACGHDRAAVVGHDWGGTLALRVAATHPERVSRIVVLNGVHLATAPAVYAGQLRQLRRGWYVLALQLPWLPERLLAARNFQALAAALRETSRPGTFTPADLAAYRRAWNRPGALRAMVHWYRAACRRPPGVAPSPTIDAPTLVIWGEDDAFLTRETVLAGIAWCRRGHFEAIAATHWLHHEEPTVVNELLEEFLG